MSRYTTWGPISGGCQHAHRSVEQAQNCLQMSKVKFEKKGQPFDREIREIEDRNEAINYDPQRGPGRVYSTHTQYNNNPNTKTVVTEQKQDVRNRFTVARRFEMMESITEMVINGYQRAMIVSGCGGTGKTYNIMNKIYEHGLTEVEADINSDDVVIDESFDCNTNYIKVTGATSPTGLYRLLYENKNSMIIMDDCDSYLNNDNAINILKAVLDTTGDGTVSWKSTFIENLGLPTSFQFKGKIIFISNKKIKQIPQPILSRSLVLDMDLNKYEIVERARTIEDSLLPDMEKEQRTELFNFVEEYINEFRDVSLRTFVLSAPYIQAGYKDKDWKDMLLFTS